MNNDNDKEVRISNGGSVVVDNGEEIRVSSGFDLGSKIGSRVMPGAGRDDNDDHVWVLDENGVNCRANGGPGDLEGVDGSSDDEDMEIEFRVADEESDDAGNEGETIGVVDNAVSGSGDRVGGATDSNFSGLGDGNEMNRGGNLGTSMNTHVVGSVSNVVVGDGLLKIMGTSFEMGDMVWGKVKSHPWWPGHIINEAFVSSVVRRSRKDGHVLVVFFGDSSYGYFDPRELIPYDPHYGEKSQQTTSKNFVRAVEDSIDEASRSSALGLSCRCRNPYNFRPTHVPGYLSIDVVDYEPGMVYSVSQIQRARESFHPSQTLTFIKHLASAPRSGERKSLDFIKQKATALAYRRSIFEEFDETYAQAFGHEPVRPQLTQAEIDKAPSRAPLSGPLVVAESLGGRRSSTKAAKPKDSSKKDRYLFKRRDEVGDLKTAWVSQVHASSSSSSANEDGISDSAAAGYVLQKRDHGIPTNSDLGVASTMDQVATSYASPTDVSGKKLSLDAINDSLQSESRAAMSAVVSDVHDPVSNRHMSNIISPDGSVTKKKKKIVKHPAGERSFEKPDISEKWMKKLKKTDGERSMDHRLISGSGENLSKSAGRPTQIIAAFREESQLNNHKKEIEVKSSVPQPVCSVSLEGVEEKEVDLAQMLEDLQGLALNPLHGGKIPAIARQFFLKFRSLVYLKASGASSMAELEPGESWTIRSSAEPGDKSLLKSSKLSPRHEDSSKGGRKRLPSERQEEMAVKKAKKITEVKSLGAEKRALLKNSEISRLDGKTKVSVSQQSSSKPLKEELHTKKMDRPPRVEEPTYLVMKFPAGSSLPSLVELKARFARFGPLDISLSRVFYTTNTCRVAFMYKQDANVAHRYAMASKSLFSNVKFMLKPVSAPEPQHSRSAKAEDLPGDQASNRDSSAGEPRPAVPVLPLMQQQQLKSCLKKPSGEDEPAGSTNGSGTVRTSRVRFNMGDNGVVSVQRESRNAMSSSEGQSCSLSSSVAMDIINNQRFMFSLPLQPSALPHPPPQFPRPPLINPQHHNEIFSRTNYNDNLTGSTEPSSLASPVPAPQTQFQTKALALPQPSIEISRQMMSLLTRCHDVLTNVRNILGYEPYHAL